MRIKAQGPVQDPRHPVFQAELECQFEGELTRYHSFATLNVPQDGSRTSWWNLTPLVTFVITCDHHITLSHIV